MYLTLIIFGLLTNTLLSVLVGFVGARHKIGFGWSFLISLIVTPLVGLLIVLLTDKLPNNEKNWGCLASLIVFLVILGVIIIAGVVIIAIAFA